MSTGNSQQSAKILSFDRFHDSESDYARDVIADIRQKHGIDFESARLLYYHRRHSRERISPLYAHESERCEALETRLAKEEAERVVSGGNGSIDWDAHDAKLRANHAPIAERSYQEREAEQAPPPLPYINMAAW